MPPAAGSFPSRDRNRAASVAGRAAAAVADVEPPSHETPQHGTSAAFFDLDGTVMRGGSLFHLARGLHQRRFFTFGDVARAGWKQARFLALGESLDHIQQIIDQALSFVAGHSVAELTAIGADVYDEVMVDKIWPGTHKLTREHLDAGQRVWLVTATPVEVADVIAGRLGLTGALGTVAESVDGVYTGRLVGEALHGAAKAEAVRALAEREGLDLSNCTAYSDSANDIPLLSLVGRPCAVNPDARLRAHARSRGWQVHDHRSRRGIMRIGVHTAGGLGAAATTLVAVTAVSRCRRRSRR